MLNLKLKIFIPAAVSLLLVCAFQAKVSADTHANLKVELVGSNETDKEKVEVVTALQKLLKGLAHRDINALSSCLSEDVTTFDRKSKTFLYGKERVLVHVKNNILGVGAEHPVKKIVVYHPFVNVKGDTAMISFRATKELANAKTMESWCSEIYERKNGEWLVLQLKTDWKVINLKPQK